MATRTRPAISNFCSVLEAIRDRSQVFSDSGRIQGELVM